MDCECGSEVETTVLMGTSINEKAEWMADITQVRAEGGVLVTLRCFLNAVCTKRKTEQDPSISKVKKFRQPSTLTW